MVYKSHSIFRCLWVGAGPGLAAFFVYVPCSVVLLRLKGALEPGTACHGLLTDAAAHAKMNPGTPAPAAHAAQVLPLLIVRALPLSLCNTLTAAPPKQVDLSRKVSEIEDTDVAPRRDGPCAARVCCCCCP